VPEILAIWEVKFKRLQTQGQEQKVHKTNGLMQWYTFVTPATLETEMGESCFQASPGKIVCKTTSQEKPLGMVEHICHE
jgi:hypothetical protein